MAIHLNFDPKFRCKSIEEVVELFKLPDLRAALGDYVKHERTAHTHTHFHTFGGVRQSSSDVNLPFTGLQVWFKVCLQQKSYYSLEETSSERFTVFTQPPDRNWKYGRYNAAILQADESHQWPMSGLQGM